MRIDGRGSVPRARWCPPSPARIRRSPRGSRPQPTPAFASRRAEIMPVRSRPAAQWTRMPGSDTAIASRAVRTRSGRMRTLCCQYSGESRMGKHTARNSGCRWSSVGARVTTKASGALVSGSPSREPISSALRRSTIDLSPHDAAAVQPASVSSSRRGPRTIRPRRVVPDEDSGVANPPRSRMLRTPSQSRFRTRGA